MSFPRDQGPPNEVRFTLDEVLGLLAALEEARDALTFTDHLAEVAQVEEQILILNRRLGFDENGGSNG